MRFLIDADLPRATASLIKDHGHEAVDVRDIGLASAEDATIAAHARRNSQTICTGDFGFADIRNYPPGQYDGIIVLELSNSATAASILHLMCLFLDELPKIGQLHGKLIVVSPGRVRIRTS